MRHSSSFFVLISALVCLPSIAAAGWTPDGVRITNNVLGSEVPGSILTDHAGGAIIFWRDQGSPVQRAQQLSEVSHAQRLNAVGNLQWASDGVSLHFDAALSDGADGAFTVWDDGDLRMQRFDGSGNPQWAPGGVLVAPIYNYALTRLIDDQAGGVIVIFQDWRPGLENQLYGQRVNGSGVPLWGTDGIPLVVLPSGQSWRVQQAWHNIASDGAGGVVAAWQDFRTHTTMDIYAQRLGPSGQRLWGNEAVLLHSPAGEQREPSLAADGAGGAFVAWNVAPAGDVFAQHVDALGAIQWGADGLAVGDKSWTEYWPMVVSDGGTGAFIAWTDMRNQTYDMYIQRYNAAGTPQWTTGGVPVSTLMGDRGIFAILPDALGGALVGFSQFGEIRAQKLDPFGARAWGNNGILMGNGGSPYAVTDGAGGMIVAYYRAVGSEYNFDVFAQRITSSGLVPTAVATPSRSPSLRVRDVYPNPFSGTTTLAIELAEPSALRVAVFDVAGRRVRDISLPAATASQRVEFNGRNDSGKLLPSGVYFCRVEARGEFVTRKLVITR